MAEAGKIIKLTGDVKAVNELSEKSLNLGDIVLLNDTIKTIGENASVDIELSSGRVLHIAGDNVAKLDKSILSNDSFENEAAIDDKINSLINNIVNNNGEIELDATAAGDAGATTATGTLNDVVFAQSGSESEVYADVLSREVDGAIITTNNTINGVNLEQVAEEVANVIIPETKPEEKPEEGNGEDITNPDNGNNNPEEGNGNNAPEEKPEEKPEEGNGNNQPEEGNGDNNQPETKPEEKPEEGNSEDITNPDNGNNNPEEGNGNNTPEEKPNNLTANVYDSNSNIVDNKLTNGTEFIIKGSGAIPNSEVIISLAGIKPDGNPGQIFFPVKVIADENGNFSCSFDLSNSDLLYQYQVENGENSVNSSFMVDNIAPEITDSKAEVVDDNIVISGKTEPEATITAPNGDKVVADKDGNFEITIPNNGDNKVEISVTDKVGNTNENTTTIDVIQPEVKPEIPADTEAPVISGVTATPTEDGKFVIEGSTEPDAVVTITKPDGSKEEVKADANGDFKFELDNVKDGDKFDMVARDEAGNVSKPVDVVASIPTTETPDNGNNGEDNNQPEIPAEPVKPTFDNLIITEINGDETVSDDLAKVDSDKLVINGKLENFKGEAGEYEFNITSNIIGSDSNSTKVIAKVDENGNFTFTLDTNVTTNEQGAIRVEFDGKADTVRVESAATQTPDNGNNGEDNNQPEIPADTEAPLLGGITATPQENGKVIIDGETEPNSVVTITKPNGDKLDVTANEKGEFSIEISDIKNGDKITIVARDEAGNVSKPGSIEINGIVETEKPIDGMKVSIYTGNEFGALEDQTQRQSGESETDRTPTFVGEFDGKGMQSVTVTITDANGEVVATREALAMNGKFVFTADLECNRFSDYTYNFAVAGTNIKGEVVFGYVDNQVSNDNDNNGNIDNNQGNNNDNVIDTEKPEVPSVENKLSVKAYEGDETGLFNNLKELPNGANTYDTTPTFVGNSGVAFDRILVYIEKLEGPIGTSGWQTIGETFTNANGDFVYTYNFTNVLEDNAWESGTYKIHLVSDKTAAVYEHTFTIVPNLGNDNTQEDANSTMKVSIYTGNEFGALEDQTQRQSGESETDRTPTFVGEFDGKGMQSVTVTITDANGEVVATREALAMNGKFVFTADLECNRFSDYTYNFAVAGTNIKGEVVFGYVDNQVSNDNDNKPAITIDSDLYYQYNNLSPLEKVNGYDVEHSPTIKGSATPGIDVLVYLINETTGEKVYTQFKVPENGEFDISLGGVAGNSYHYEIYESIDCKPVGEPAVSHSFNVVKQNSFIEFDKGILSADEGLNIPEIKNEANKNAENEVKADDILDIQKDIFNETISQAGKVQEGYINISLSAYDVASKELAQIDEFNKINHHS